MADTQKQEDPHVHLRQQYEQVCASYHAIDDFRGKLLALWPILGGAAGGIALLVAKDADAKGDLAAMVGLFGLTATIGIALYEWSQSLRCAQLRTIGQQLENELLRDYTPKKYGQFSGTYSAYKFAFALGARNPAEGDWLRPGLASSIVYGAVAFGWAGVMIWGLVNWNA